MSNDKKLPVLDTDQYEHVRHLGKGGFGVCNLMRDKVTGEEVAVKLLERGPRITDNTRREVAFLRRLRHPNIVACKQVFLTPDYLCIAMEYAPGRELYAHVTSSKLGRLPEDQARYFIRQLLAGMEYFHALGVWHRDLKLENVLLDSSSPQRIKICDFGLSKGSQDSKPKSRVGTDYYMSPEVCVSSAANRYDGQAADVWALGVVLYTLVVGRYPFVDLQDMYNKASVHERIMRLQVNKPPDSFKLSPACLDLLSKIFVPADRRIKLQKIKEHDWVAQALPAEYQQALDADAAVAATAQQAGAAAEGVQSEAEVQELVQLARQLTLPAMHQTPAPGYQTPAPRFVTEGWLLQDAVNPAMDQSCGDSYVRCGYR